MRFRERDSERKKRRMAGRNLEEMSNHNFCVEQVPSHIATVGGHLKITVRFPHKHSQKRNPGEGLRSNTAGTIGAISRRYIHFRFVLSPSLLIDSICVVGQFHSISIR